MKMLDPEWPGSNPHLVPVALDREIFWHHN